MVFLGLQVAVLVVASHGVIAGLEDAVEHSSAEHSWAREKREVGGWKCEVQTARDGSLYLAYRGIAYAEPPVEELRFRNPRPSRAPRQRDGLQEGPKCAQIAVPSGQQEGEEDCLYLNVYTPMMRHGTSSWLPVMVYIHGGGFTYGSGTAAENGPEFLVRHDVILVTLNYRLGAFGFLNLDNDDIPGNMGLKDQQAALRWVQKHIRLFSGDPEKVTIFGNSAGSASVHLHTLVPSSKGLFRAAIMQSGNALASWAYQEKHLERARGLAEQLGAPKDADAVLIARTIRAASTTDIIQATARMVKTDPSLRLGSPPFGPTPERRSGGTEATFLVQDPESLERRRQVPAVPTIAGITGEEGHFALAYGGLDKQPALVEALKQNPAILLPSNLVPSAETAKILGLQSHNLTLSPEQTAKYGALIKEAYNLTDTDHFTTLFGDLFNAVSTHRMAGLRLQLPLDEQAPLYLYHFLEDGEYNWGKRSFGITAKGATHTDELGYLMHITSPVDLHQTGIGSTPSSLALNMLTKLWTHFAASERMEDFKWRAAVGPALTATYAKLTSDYPPPEGVGLGGPRMRLWDDLFGALRDETPAPLNDLAGAS